VVGKRPGMDCGVLELGWEVRCSVVLRLSSLGVFRSQSFWIGGFAGVGVEAEVEVGFKVGSRYPLRDTCNSMLGF
jgi:hypothetical protein